MNHVPHTVAALLDLVPPHVIQQIIDYQTNLPGDSVDNWEPRHLYAAEMLCSYVESTYLQNSQSKTSKLREKLQLLD